MARKSITPSQKAASKRQLEKQKALAGLTGKLPSPFASKAPGAAAQPSAPGLSVDVTAKGERAPSQPGRFTDVETGAVTGITLPAIGNKPPRTFLGLTPADVKQIMERQGLTEEDVPLISEQQLRESSAEEAAETFEQALGEGAPEARGLIPGTTPPEGVIDIGRETASIEAIRIQTMLSLINPEAIKNMTYADFLMHPDVVNNPLFREIIQSELDFEVFKTGEATATNAGTFIEGIPGVGGAARKWAGRLITVPSGQIDDIRGEISTEVSYARNLREWVGMNTISVEFAREELQRINDRLRWLESKLKILTTQSPELKSSPEEIEAIQSEIQQALTVVFNGQLKAFDVAVRGADEPSAEQLFKTYQDVKSK